MKRILLLLLVLSMISCGSAFKRLMLGGKVVQTDFYETITMDFSKGLPLINVEIQGNTYQFLFDTGAPNVISKELSEKIKYKVVSSPQINDSQGGKRTQKSVKIDNIRIGKIDFENTGAIIIDYMKVYALACFEFDGIIGSNLMAKAFWEIDYEKSTLSFSDKLSTFEMPSDVFTLPFTPKSAQRKPMVKVKVNNMTFNSVTFDTGATGSFGLKTGEAKSIIDTLEGVELVGSISSGVYGDGGVSTTKYAKVDSVKLGDIKFSDQVVEFESKGSMTLGNTFLKNYRVMMDWPASKMYLAKIDQFDIAEYGNFGFLSKVEDRKLLVKGIVKGSAAEEKGIKLGTEILQINDLDFRNVSVEDGCDFLTSKIMREMDEIQMTIIEDGKERLINLSRQVFVSSKEN